MIKFITVWALVVIFDDTGSSAYVRRDSYKLQYATYATCVKQGEKIKKRSSHYDYRCEFEQIPIGVK